jgi:hypothetical protein
MSVWSYVSSTHSPALLGSEGELVSISVAVEPRDLEDLLEALAALDFPINPQIYHDAALVSVEHDGNERVEPRTIVEFPAYAGRLEKIRAVLGAYGFSGETIIAFGVSMRRRLARARINRKGRTISSAKVFGHSALY